MCVRTLSPTPLMPLPLLLLLLLLLLLRVLWVVQVVLCGPQRPPACQHVAHEAHVHEQLQHALVC